MHCSICYWGRVDYRCEDTRHGELYVVWLCGTCLPSLRGIFSKIQVLQHACGHEQAIPVEAKHCPTCDKFYRDPLPVSPSAGEAQGSDVAPTSDERKSETNVLANTNTPRSLE